MTENEVQEAPMTTYALWGMGDITKENATALLEEYIPDNVGTVFRPDRAPRGSGLRTALDWFESPDFLGDGGAVASTDLIQSLADERDGKFHDEVYLLALWPNDPSHEDFDFIERAQQSGITVFALSHAFVELDLSLYSRPEATKEEKAEARAEARKEKKGRGRPRKLSDDAPKEETFVSPAVKAAGSEMVTAAEPLDCEGLLFPAQDVPELPFVYLDDDGAAQMFKGIKLYIDARVDAGIKAAMQSLGESARPVLHHEEHPPFDPPYTGRDTKPYFFSKTTNVYREGTGKPRRGEILVNMTEEEAQEKGAL